MVVARPERVVAREGDRKETLETSRSGVRWQDECSPRHQQRSGTPAPNCASGMGNAAARRGAWNTGGGSVNNADALIQNARRRTNCRAPIRLKCDEELDSSTAVRSFSTGASDSVGLTVTRIATPGPASSNVADSQTKIATNSQ